MKLSLIVAMSENRVIGRDNRLPWHLPADLKRFKQLTMGHAIIMGRKTFESIGRVLPGRRSIVITRRLDFRLANVEMAHSLDEAIDRAPHDTEAFVIGGAEVFREALARVSRMYITRVHAQIQGDVHFPEVNWSAWKRTHAQRHQADALHQYAFTFETFERVSGPSP